MRGGDVVSGRRSAVGAAAGVVLAAAAVWRSVGELGGALGAADVLVGVILVLCGVAGRARRADSRAGALMEVSGLTWLAGSVASLALFWHRGPLVHLTLSYPTGRLRRRLAAVTVVLAYVDATVRPFATNDGVTLGLAALVGVAAIDGFMRTSGPARRAGLVALGCGIAYAAALAIGAWGRLAGWDADEAVLLGYDAVVASIAVIMLLQLLFGGWREATVADLVVALGQRAGTGRLRDQLARALGDPSLVVGYWIDESGSYVDDLGRTVALPPSGAGRTVSTLTEGGLPVAVLVHDAVTMDDPQLLAAVAAAARLAVVNVRLRADIQGRVSALAAARRRIVEAGDAQRRQLELELSDGAARRLDVVSRLLDDARRGDGGRAAALGLEDLVAELRGARAELHELAQGIRPRLLGEGGLAAALPALVGRARMPVDLTVDVGRLPPSVEAALYFVCSEALANIAKHSAATHASIGVTGGNGSVTATVTDNGGGGIDPALGTGLRGLADRVEALGGRFDVGDRDGGGTVVTATVPVESTGVSPGGSTAG